MNFVSRPSVVTCGNSSLPLKCFCNECYIEDDKIVCERCEKYMELIDNNFHDEAEDLGECGCCEIY